MADRNGQTPPSIASADPRRRWVAPAVTDLPRLTELTLATGPFIPGNGNSGGGGSTVIP